MPLSWMTWTGMGIHFGRSKEVSTTLEQVKKSLSSTKKRDVDLVSMTLAAARTIRVAHAGPLASILWSSTVTATCLSFLSATKDMIGVSETNGKVPTSTRASYRSGPRDVTFVIASFAATTAPGTDGWASNHSRNADVAATASVVSTRHFTVRGPPGTNPDATTIVVHTKNCIFLGGGVSRELRAASAES